MSSIGRCIAPTGSALALLLALAVAAPARADGPMVATLGTQTIRFARLSSSMGAPAIGLRDPGFTALLRATGSVLTWKPGDRYVLITTGAPTVVSFAVGDPSYEVGPTTSQAAFAPYQVGNQVYLPLDALLNALGLALHRDSRGAVLQPQLTSLDVKSDASGVTLVARAGVTLHPLLTPSANADSVTYVFDGVGTTIAGTRAVGSGGVRAFTLAQSGTVRHPVTTLRVSIDPGASHAAPSSDDGRDALLAFAGNGAPPASVASASIASQPSAIGASPIVGTSTATPSSGPTTVTGVSVTPTDQGTSVTVAVSGNATYTWHRLRAPDNRFWLDIVGAQLAGPPIQENEPDPLIAVRVRQVDPTTVRIAISLVGQNALDVSPSADGLTIAVGKEEVADAARSGSGSLGGVVSVAEAAAPVTPAPAGETPPDFGPGWKFGSRSSYVPTNPKLIVIDPGHGGSDRGASRNGTDEATLTLDMAKRLQAILIARGWQVQMTRDTDVDVYAPNDSAKQELQARDDIANQAGARMLVSIHANAYINAGPNGTTVYYAKRDDIPLAHEIDTDLGAMLGTKDDGVVKSRFYIPLHAEMPSVLIETAFLSNPHDYALLTSPQWRQRVAEWIADGIDRYAQAYPIAGQPAQ